MEFEGFTPEQLRTQLVDNLSRNGIKEKLKSQLRSKIFAELRVATRIPTNIGPESNQLIVKVADSMFVEYLKNRGFEFTLSVFLPECGINNLNKALTEKDLLRALHLDGPGITIVENDPALPSSLLLRLLESLHSINNKSTLDKQNQTNVQVDDLLHIKIRDMDRTIRSRTVQYDTSQSLLLEERMYAFQREVEESCNLKMNQQIENFKRLELTKAKLEAKSQFQAHLEAQKQEYEQKIIQAQSRSTVIASEDRERLAAREREMERQNLKMKQQLLDEQNNFIIKEKQLRNETELNARQVELERDQLKHRVQEVQEQLEKLQEFKERYTKKMEEAMSQYKIDLVKEYSSLSSNVEIEKAKIEGDKKMVQEKEASLDRLLSQAGKSDADAVRYRSELNEALLKLEESSRIRESLLTQVNDLQLQVLTQKGSSTLEFEISSLKRQLSNTEKAASIRYQEYEASIKSLTESRGANDSDLGEIRKSEMRWKQRCQELVSKLDMEFSTSEDLSRKLDREKLRNKELDREQADTKLLLHQAQSALKLASSSTSIPLFEDPPPDPLYERYAKITSTTSQKTTSLSPHQRIPLPSSFERSNEPIWKDDFLTSQELALLKSGKIPSLIPLASSVVQSAVSERDSDSFAVKVPVTQKPDISHTTSTPLRVVKSAATEKSPVVEKVVIQDIIKPASIKKASPEVTKIVALTDSITASKIPSETSKVEDGKDIAEERKLEIEKLREEERLKAAEKLAAEKAKEEVMKGVDTLEKDPLLQKYLALVREKRGIQEGAQLPTIKAPTPDRSSTSFGAGDTDMSAPENDNSSSNNPW